MIDRLIYGGSFNPIHKGHLATIEYVLNHGICKEILIIPTYQSPLKEKNIYASAELRFKMIEKAISNYFRDDLQSKIILSDIEIKEKTINYTVNTLKRLENNIQTGILIGADSLQTLLVWKEIEWILKNYSFYIIARANYSKNIIEKAIKNIMNIFPSSRLILLDFYPPDCSSSEIRKKLRQLEPYENFKDCLSEEVYNLIKENHLYLD